MKISNLHFGHTWSLYNPLVVFMMMEKDKLAVINGCRGIVRGMILCPQEYADWDVDGHTIQVPNGFRAKHKINYPKDKNEFYLVGNLATKLKQIDNISIRYLAIEKVPEVSSFEIMLRNLNAGEEICLKEMKLMKTSLGTFIVLSSTTPRYQAGNIILPSELKGNKVP